MPLSVLEAMASGLPVVATDVGDVRAMLSAENAARVVAKDEAALAAGLDALLADADLRSALGRANRARTGRDFDQETMFAAWAALYDEGIAAGKRRGATA
jgi:glycosyltransferase involved in cell wall biosynthesis